MVQKWFTEFRCVRTSTETIPSPGRPNEITTAEMTNKNHDIVLNDPKVKMHEKALCKIGAAISHNRPKTHSCGHLGAKFCLF